MSEAPSHPNDSGLALSAAPPFLFSLASQASDPSLRPDVEDDPVSDPASKNRSPAVLGPLHHVHDQKDLSAVQVKSVQGTLSSNNGGISSGTQSAIPAGAKPVFGDGSGPPLGPPSNTRRVTRSSTLSNGVSGAAPASVDGPVTASVDSDPVDPDHPSNVQATVDIDRIPSPSTKRYEIGGSTIKRTTKNLAILSDVARTTETQANKLALDLDKLTVEVRLNNAPFSFQDRVSRSPTPTLTRSISCAPSAPRDDGSTRDDIEEL
ncbi:hypothetical protein K438DRAFT_1988724 [Mycena galopus ATCC 62051]|nr:hypothetical protein K438DRAFT_1988724 [Mycena galopus ATCC 62051]